MTATRTPTTDTYAHPLALCESISVGRGTKIWPFAHVTVDAVVGTDCNICGHSFIAAGAVVTRDVPPQSLQVGNPARHAGWVCDCGRPLDGNSYCDKCQRTCSSV